MASLPREGIGSVTESHLHTLFFGVGRKGFDKAGYYHIIHGCFIRQQAGRCFTCGDDGMVVGYLGIVHRVAIERSRECLSYLAKQDGYFLEDILADVSAAGAGIGRDFLLIEALGYREGLVC